MWCLWAKMEGIWRVYATLEERTGDYAEQVTAGILRANQSESESRRNAAKVMQRFVLQKVYYARKFGKVVLRALRHFDEVGLSNEIYALLEEALDEGAEAFLLGKDGDEIESFEESVLEVRI